MLSDIPQATHLVTHAIHQSLSKSALPVPDTSSLITIPIIDKTENRDAPFSDIELALAMYFHDTARAEQYITCGGSFNDQKLEHGDTGAKNLSAFFELMHLGVNTANSPFVSQAEEGDRWTSLRQSCNELNIAQMQKFTEQLGSRFSEDGTSGQKIDWEATRFAVYAHNKFETPEQLFNSYLKERSGQIQVRIEELQDLLQSSPDGDSKKALENLYTAYQGSQSNLLSASDKRATFIRLARIVRDVDCVAIAMDTLGGIKDMTAYNIERKYPDATASEYAITPGLVGSIQKKALYLRKTGESSPTDLILSMLNCTLAAVTPEVYKLYLQEISDPKKPEVKMSTITAVFKLAADTVREKCKNDTRTLSTILQELHAVKGVYLRSVEGQFGLADQLGGLNESIDNAIDFVHEDGGTIYNANSV